MIDYKHIEVKLARATTLPILPNAVTQILALPDDSGLCARDYERIIVQDAALTAKILRTANSAFAGGTGQVTTLQRAINQLGVNVVRSICITVAFHSRMAMKSLPASFDVSAYWKHSLAVACMTKVLAIIKKHPRPEEAFIAGLFHDIGKMAIAMLLPDEANRVYSLANHSHLSHFEAELEELSMTHQEIGLRAAELWKLPETFHGAISCHHTLMDKEELPDTLTCLVHIANALAHSNDMGYAIAGDINAMNPDVLKKVGVPEAQFVPIIHAVQTELVRLKPYLGA